MEIAAARGLPQRAARRLATRASTSSPSGTTRPVSSAIRMNSSVGTSTPSWCQRTRASTPTIRSVRAVDDGLVDDRRGRRPRSPGAAPRPAAGPPSAPGRSSARTATAWAFPRPLASYIARSALRSSASADSLPSPKATPIEQPRVTGSAPTRARGSGRPGSGRRSRRPRRTEMSSSSTANSSPPSLATVSLSRVHSTSRRATSTSTASPAACPKRSLTGLNESRSMKSSATRTPAAPGPVQGVRHPVEQDPAVGQVGERVVARVVDHVGGQLDPGVGVRAEHRQRVERLLVRRDRRPGPVPGGRHHPERVLAPLHLGADLVREPAAPARSSTSFSRISRRASYRSASPIWSVSCERLDPHGRLQQHGEPPRVLATAGDGPGGEQQGDQRDRRAGRASTTGCCAAARRRGSRAGRTGRSRRSPAASALDQLARAAGVACRSRPRPPRARSRRRSTPRRPRPSPAARGACRSRRPRTAWNTRAAAGRPPGSRRRR